MIKLIEGDNALLFPREIGAMHRNRAEIFGPCGHNWDVVVNAQGEEIDTFDDANPLYVIVTSDAGEYQASLRLLPTTGPNMLRDVFSELLPPGDTVESATIWESSRICAERNATGALRELLIGIGMAADRAGLTQIVSVFDERIYRILRGVGLHMDDLAPPKMIGGVKTRAALFDVGEETRAKWRARWGVRGACL